MAFEANLANPMGVMRLLLIAATLAALVLGVWWLRQGQRTSAQRLAALTALTLFLTFDLTVFGAFTRLTDSGLGCPDWPGCYGHASPIAAHGEISAAQTAAPTGPVTHQKAWIEMIHRYLAMTVGALIVVMAVWSFALRKRLPHGWLWPWVTLAWVIVQGMFGKYTVTLKLFPAIVTLHWLGALALLGLLLKQHHAWRGDVLPMSQGLARAAPWLAAVLVLQSALGAWVSTNYAVLACVGFPTCNGQWWPAMDAAQGFALWRELGQTAAGEPLPVQALVAIHMAHRGFALVAVLAVGAWAWAARHALPLRRTVLALVLLTAAQVLTGISNVVMGWPLLAAITHSAGAAALVCVGVSIALRARRQVNAQAEAPSGESDGAPRQRQMAAEGLVR